MENLTKKQAKAESIRRSEAKRHLKKLRLFAAQNLIKICDGDFKAAVNALMKSYGHLYGDNKIQAKSEPEQASEPEPVYILTLDGRGEQCLKDVQNV